MVTLLKNKALISLLILLAIPITSIILSNQNIYNDSSICLFTNLFNIDCYGCGMFRSILSFINGNFIAAIDYNAKIFIVLPMLIMIWAKKVTNLLYEINSV